MIRVIRAHAPTRRSTRRPSARDAPVATLAATPGWRLGDVRVSPRAINGPLLELFDQVLRQPVGDHVSHSYFLGCPFTVLRVAMVVHIMPRSSFTSPGVTAGL